MRLFRAALGRILLLLLVFGSAQGSAAMMHPRDADVLDMTPAGTYALIHAHEFAAIFVDYTVDYFRAAEQSVALRIEYSEPVVILQGGERRGTARRITGIARFGPEAERAETALQNLRFDPRDWRPRGFSYVLSRELGLTGDNLWYSAQSRGFFSLQRRFALPLAGASAFEATFKYGTKVLGINLRMRARGSRPFIAHWAHAPRSRDAAAGDVYRLDLEEYAKKHDLKLSTLELTEVIFLLDGTMSRSAAEAFVGFETIRRERPQQGLSLSGRVVGLGGNRYRLIVDQRAVAESWIPRVLEKVLLTLPAGGTPSGLRFVYYAPYVAKTPADRESERNPVPASSIWLTAIAGIALLSTIASNRRWRTRELMLLAVVGSAIAFAAYGFFRTGQRAVGVGFSDYLSLYGLLGIAVLLTAYAAALATCFVCDTWKDVWPPMARFATVKGSLTVDSVLWSSIAALGAIYGSDGIALSFASLCAASIVLASVRMAIGAWMPSRIPGYAGKP